MTQSGPPDLFCVANSILMFDSVFLNWQVSHKNSDVLALLEVRRAGCTGPAFPTRQFLGQLSALEALRSIQFAQSPPLPPSVSVGTWSLNFGTRDLAGF